MEIIEQYLASKIDDLSRCEDGLFISEKYIAVIDGVTSKGKLDWNGRTSGYHAKETIKLALAALTGTESWDQVFQALNQALYWQYDNPSFFEEHPEERLQATLVIYSVHARQIWLFGDCQYRINDRLHTNEMKIDELLAEVRAVYLELEMLQGKSMADLCEKDPSFEMLFPVFQKQFSLANRDSDYGYQVMNGFCTDFSTVHIEDVPGGSTVVLASDGYPRLLGSLAESERYLDDLRKKDPLCIKEYKSTRGFTNGKTALDDKAYIRFIS